MDSRLPRSNHPPRLRVREAVAKPQAAVSLFGLSAPQRVDQVTDYLCKIGLVHTPSQYRLRGWRIA